MLQHKLDVECKDGKKASGARCRMSCHDLQYPFFFQPTCGLILVLHDHAEFLALYGPPPLFGCHKPA